MNTARWERVGPVAGLLAVLLTVISLAMVMPDSPDFMDDAETITSWYADDPGKLMGGYLIDAFGTILLVVFAAGLYVRLGGVRQGPLAPAAFGGAIAMCAMFMVYDAIHLALSWRADEDGSVPTEGAVVMNDLSFFAIGMGATMFAAVFVACAGLSALSPVQATKTAANMVAPSPIAMKDRSLMTTAPSVGTLPSSSARNDSAR